MYNSNVISYNEKDKTKCILAAIESGWSVKKISNEDYQFSKKFNRTGGEGRLLKRSFSVPITKSEHMCILTDNDIQINK